MTDPLAHSYKFPAQRTVEYQGRQYLIVMTPNTLKIRWPDGIWYPAYLYISKDDGQGYTREMTDMESKFTLSNRQ